MIALGDGDRVAAFAGIHRQAAGAVAHVNADDVVARAGVDGHAVFRRAIVDDVDLVDAVAGVDAQRVEISRDVHADLVVADARADIHLAAVQRGIYGINAVAGGDGQRFCALLGFDCDDVVVVRGGDRGAGLVAHDEADLVRNVLAADKHQLSALLPKLLLRGVRTVLNRNHLFGGHHDAVHQHLDAVYGDITVHDARAAAFRAAGSGIFCGQLQLKIVRHTAVPDLDPDVSIVGHILLQHDLQTPGQRAVYRDQGVVDHGLEHGLRRRYFGGHGRRFRGCHPEDRRGRRQHRRFDLDDLFLRLGLWARLRRFRGRRGVFFDCIVRNLPVIARHRNRASCR